MLASGSAKVRNKDKAVDLTLSLTSKARKAVRAAGQVTVVYDSSDAGILSGATVTFRVPS